jgi:hypothetical protein
MVAENTVWGDGGIIFIPFVCGRDTLNPRNGLHREWGYIVVPINILSPSSIVLGLAVVNETGTQTGVTNVYSEILCSFVLTLTRIQYFDSSCESRKIAQHDNSLYSIWAEFIFEILKGKGFIPTWQQ